VTVFEASDKAGGFLRDAIPDFRLPISEVENAISILKKMGIKFNTKTQIDLKQNIQEFKDRYDAVLICSGARKSTELNNVSINKEYNIINGLTLLQEYKDNKENSIYNIKDKEIVIVGGGNTAIDTAIVSKKIGAKEVNIVCLERLSEMPAYEDEIKKALNLGVKIKNCWAIESVQRKNENRLTLNLQRCLEVFDINGKFNPVIDNTSPLYSMDTDIIMVAIGLEADLSLMSQNLLTGTNCLNFNKKTYQSLSDQKIFFAGDCATGPSSVVHAMASGREAAVSVDRFLTGDSMTFGRNDYVMNGWIHEYSSIKERARGAERCDLYDSENDVEKDLSQEEAVQEAERCLSCGRPYEINKTCWYCLPCEIECPYDAIEVKLPYQIR
jgi:NADPH-dependent glutamate synthase beta subunit-like oxidoreductase/NAD-dependent dihydropyrimidine dehydrogenase PreA subunit